MLIPPPVEDEEQLTPWRQPPEDPPAWPESPWVSVGPLLGVPLDEDTDEDAEDSIGEELLDSLDELSLDELPGSAERLEEADSLLDSSDDFEAELVDADSLDALE